MKVLIRRVQVFEKEVEIPDEELITSSAEEYLADHDQQAEVKMDDCTGDLTEYDVRTEKYMPGIYIPPSGEGDSCR